MALRFATPKRPAAALFALLLGIYLLTSGGHFYAIDEEMMYGLTEAVGARGTLALNNPGPAEVPSYSTYGPGQSLAALPLFWAGQFLARALPPEARPWLIRALVGWFNPVITALLAALIYQAGRRLGTHRAALLAALAYGLGSMAWPHSKSFFAEPFVALLWFGAFALIWRPNGPSASLRFFVLAGALAGLAPAVKIQTAIVLPILALWACAQAPLPWRWRRCAAWAVGAAMPLALLAVYNTALFGGPLRTGYGTSILSSFSAPFWQGFAGQLWGLRRGLLWCAPLLLLVPVGLLYLWRRDRAAALLCAAIPLSQLLLYATWYAWDGAGSWGPRFLNAGLPFLALPLAAIAPASLRSRHWLRAAAIVLAALSLPVQIGALSININQLLTRPGGEGPSQVWSHLEVAAARAGRLYERSLAPERLVFLVGLAPSEGAGNALVPRWTLPEARFVVRPPHDTSAILTLATQSCWARPGPTLLSLSLDGVPVLAEGRPCPGRVYRLLLPHLPSELLVSSPGWSPADAGLDRDDAALGVYLEAIDVAADGRPLAVVGDRLPAEVAPLGSTAMRQWMGDPRLALWDFWWAYLPLLPIPAATRWAIGLVWGGVGLAAVLAGAYGLVAMPKPAS